MLKNVPSDKMDDPAVEPIGINTLFFARLSWQESQENVESFYFILFSAIWESFAMVAKKKKKKKKRAALRLFSALQCFGAVRALLTAYSWTLIVVATISISCRHKKETPHRGEWNTGYLQQFFIIRTDGHAGVCTYKLLSTYSYQTRFWEGARG